MAIDVNALRKVFQPKAVAETLRVLEPVPNVLTQVVFADKKNHPMPVIGIDEIQESSGTLPLVRYGEHPTEIDQQTRTVTLVEPEPIAVKKAIRPREIALLQTMLGESLRQYSQDKIDMFRRKIQSTTAALCGQALNGRLQHPIRTDVGVDVYEFTYGTIATYTPASTWDTTGAKPLVDLDKMMTELQKKNVGGPYVVLAGELAYQELLRYLEAKEKVTVSNYVRIDEMAKIPYIEYFGFRIYKVAETYTDVNGNAVPVIDPKTVFVLGELPYKLRFLALDDLDYGLVAMPMLVKVVKKEMGTSLELVAQSKPFPIPRVNAIIKAQVLP